MTSKAVAWAAKRVAGDIVTRIFEVGNMVVGLSLYQAALTEPHVALDRENVTFEGGELGLGPQEGVREVVHVDDLCI
jgi:hypothetical protein